MTKTTTTILKCIAACSEPFRVHLQRDCQKHSEAQCNGDYYFDDDTQEWLGYDRTTFTNSADHPNAKKGKKAEASITKRILTMCGTEMIPPFITYNGDPRGFVIKIAADRLSDEEKELTNELGFIKDWGGDYSIVKHGEV